MVGCASMDCKLISSDELNACETATPQVHIEFQSQQF